MRGGGHPNLGFGVYLDKGIDPDIHSDKEIDP